MDSIALVSLSVALSTLASAAVVLATKTKVSIENGIKHLFDVELEKLKLELELSKEKFKSELATEGDVARSINERRFRPYPHMVELVYRTRNLAREICEGIGPNPTLVDELAARWLELQDAIFEARSDLERDHLFETVH